MTVKGRDGSCVFLTLSGHSKTGKHQRGSEMSLSLRLLRIVKISGLISVIFLVLASQTYAIRIKDVADIEGVRNNKLIGYGLVVGLDGTGDGNKSEFTNQSMSSMLDKMGIKVDPKDIDVANVAAVMVISELPAFTKQGSRIDAIVSSIGDAESLYGGTLLFTPLKGANGEVYAVAQGSVVIGGFSAGGSDANVQKNFPTVGRIVNGTTIEREIRLDFAAKQNLSLALHHPDFTTALRITEAINQSLLEDVAKTPDAGTVKIQVPKKFQGNIVQLVSLVEGLNITPDSIAKVVINERTGTVIIGQDVRISSIAIAHGNLSITIKEETGVSQPLPFSNGKTVLTSESNLSVKEEQNRLMLVQSGVSIGELVKALNALGISPRDLITIFQSLKASGALQAELETI
jgi:flagellar P-ring protein FlgI